MSTITKIASVILVGLVIPSLSGCSFIKEMICDIPTDTTETVFVPLQLPVPPTVALDDITWYVITPENAKEKFKELKDQGIDAVFFGLTDKGYETQSLNEEKLQGHILLMHDREKQSETYYKSMEERLNSDNKKGAQGSP